MLMLSSSVKLSSIVALLLVLCPVVSARTPSRATLGHRGLSGRLQGAGVHPSANPQPRGMEELSWWPTKTAEKAAVKAAQPAKARLGSISRPAKPTTVEEQLGLLLLAACVGTLSACIDLVTKPLGSEARFVYANGSPAALLL